MNRQFATAFAPASIGNVAVGFDVLGLSFPAIGDRVRAKRTRDPYVTIASISGVTVDLPVDPDKNTAGNTVLGLLQTMQPGFGVELKIEKGIPLGSGLGGSAASAVAAVVATNALLPQPLTPEQLLPFAMQGGGERCRARRQHCPFVDRRPGVDGGCRSPSSQADSRAGRDPLRAGPSAHGVADARGAADSQSLGASVECDLAVGERFYEYVRAR